MRNIPKFKSFFMAGFECTYALAEKGRRFDLLAASGHDKMVRQDYEMLAEKKIFTVREGFSWSGIDKGNRKYDFSRFEPMLKAGNEYGIQQLWDLNHFDFPADVDPFTPAFAKRYGEYAKRALEQIRKYQTGTLYICPMNEPSFFAWMCDQGLWAPYKKGKGTEFKKQLVKAAITAMEAIWSVDKNVIFLHCDPYMHRRPWRTRNEDDQKFCDHFNQKVKFHSWDMLSGKANPELGGDPKYLSLLGINYYFYNQQQVRVERSRGAGSGSAGKETSLFKSVPLNSPIRLPLSEIVKEIYGRYHAPMILAETGSRGQLRLTWWPYILKEIQNCITLGQPVYGVCAYPSLDILKGSGFIFPRSGLWDFDQKTRTLERIPHNPTFKVIGKFISNLRGKNKASLNMV